jgi:hypothetical protein
MYEFVRSVAGSNMTAVAPPVAPWNVNQIADNICFKLREFVDLSPDVCFVLAGGALKDDDNKSDLTAEIVTAFDVSHLNFQLFGVQVHDTSHSFLQRDLIPYKELLQEMNTRRADGRCPLRDQLVHVRLYEIGDYSKKKASRLLDIPAVDSLWHYSYWNQWSKFEECPGEIDKILKCLNTIADYRGQALYTFDKFKEIVAKVVSDYRRDLVDPNFSNYFRENERTEEHKKNHMMAITNPSESTRAKQSANATLLCTSAEHQQKMHDGAASSSSCIQGRSTRMKERHVQARIQRGEESVELPLCTWCESNTLGKGSSDDNKLCATCGLRTTIQNGEGIRADVRPNSTIISLEKKIAATKVMSKKEKLEKALSAVRDVAKQKDSDAVVRADERRAKDRARKRQKS